MTLKILIFTFSLLSGISVFSQSVRIDKIRIGIDPIRSASMLLKEKDFYNNQIYFNTWEATAEIIGPYRTSIIAETGFTRAHLQGLNSTVDYYSKGNYVKVGLDFLLVDNLERYEFDIGWRFGYSNFTERGTIRLEGHYWDNQVLRPFSTDPRQVTWGEILINQNLRLSTHNKYLDNFWVGLAFRIKFMGDLLERDGMRSLMIPGYGPYGGFSPGITFNLCYQFDIKRTVIQQLTHRHNNVFSYKHARFHKIPNYHHMKSMSSGRGHF